MVSTQLLVGDVRGFSIESNEDIFISCCLVVFTIFFLCAIHGFLSRIRLTKQPVLAFKGKVRKRLLVFIFFLQAAYLLFCLVYGVNISGSGNSTTSSPLRFVWVFVNVDILFLLSYPILRNDLSFKWLVIFQIASSLARGASGVILFIFLLELSWLHRRKVLRAWHVVLPAVILVLAYPILNLIKFSVRLAFKKHQSIDAGSTELAVQIFAEGYFSAVLDGVAHIVERLQLVSLAAEASRFSSTIQDSFEQGEFFPFWKEGVHGIILDAILVVERNVPIGTAFTNIGRFSWDFEYGSWNTNIGLSGWALAMPLYSLVLVVYVVFLCAINVFLSRLTNNSRLAGDLTLLIFFAYLLPAWFQPFVSILVTQLLFIAICIVLGSHMVLQVREPKLNKRFESQTQVCVE